MLSRFHLILERYGQTDRFAIPISRVSMLTSDKNPFNVLLLTFQIMAILCHIKCQK